MSPLSKLGMRSRYMLCVTASAIGRNSYFIIVAWIVVNRSHGATLMAILLAVGSVAEFLTTNFGGRIIDRYNRWTVCFCCDFLRLAVIAGTMLAWRTFDPLLVLSISWTLYAVIDRTFLTSLQAMIPAFTDRDELVRMNSIFSTSTQAGNLAAAAAAGVLLVSVPQTAVFILPIVCFSTSVVALAATELRTISALRDAKAEIAGARACKKAGYSAVRIEAVAYAMTYAMGMIINVLASALVVSRPGGTALHFGYLEACWAVGSLFGCALLLCRNALLLRQTALLFLSGFILTVFLFANDLRVDFVLIILLGVTYNVARIILDAKIHRDISFEQLGRYRSRVHTLCVALGLLTYAGVALVSSSLPPATIFGYFGLLLLSASAVFVILERRGAAAGGLSRT